MVKNESVCVYFQSFVTDQNVSMTPDDPSERREAQSAVSENFTVLCVLFNISHGMQIKLL